ncbi:putative defense protein 3 [Pollicipes pollicipes]|uniref:putative defense protein 3 n=1 Tax=Pollicipes pollicipes TaxID=41117 RepID=UPI0018859FC1|nr:putative defense protein 3 [Pollicipes pollicipes]
MLRVRCLLLVLAACAACLQAFPSGAPVEACLRGMTPNHGNSRSDDPGSSPFVVTRRTRRDRVEVSIHAVGGAYIKGFMIQARDPATGRAARDQGKWREVENVKQLPECAAVTHGDRNKKTSIAVTWEGRGDVAIYATVLQSYSLYWANVEAVEEKSLGGPGPSGPGLGGPARGRPLRPRPSPGFSPSSPGFFPNSQRFPPNPQKFSSNRQKFSPNSQRFSPNPQKFSPDSQRFSPNSQGFPPSSQGFFRPPFGNQK